MYQTDYYVSRIKFYDELRGGREGAGGEESSVDRPSPDEGGEALRPAAVETKILELSNISVEVGGVGEGKQFSLTLSIPPYLFTHLCPPPPSLLPSLPSPLHPSILPSFLSLFVNAQFVTQTSTPRPCLPRISLESQWHVSVVP